MNSIRHPGTPNSESGACAVVPRGAPLVLSVLLCVGLAACSFLKPARHTTRYFVLAPLPATRPTPAASSGLAVGVGQVKVPAYLYDTSLAVRKGTNEIEYLPATLWAERLDAGLQRVLAANLAVLLPTDRIRLSSWNREDVTAEIYVALEQFDVDGRGRGTLVARWRIAEPGGEKTVKAGESRLTREGPAPAADPAGAVATLSALVADCSRQIAQAISDVTPPAVRR